MSKKKVKPQLNQLKQALPKDVLTTPKAKKFKYSPNVTLVKVLEELEAINKILDGQNKDLLTAAELITNAEVDIKGLSKEIDGVNNRGFEAEVELSNRIKEVDDNNKVLAGFVLLALLVSIGSLVLHFI